MPDRPVPTTIFAPAPAGPEPPDPSLARAIVLLHELMLGNAVATRQVAVDVRALTELLVERGAIDPAALAARRARLAPPMLAELHARWEGAQLLAESRDKYQEPGVEIDCGPRLAICKAACCRLPFYLSPQDLAEGVVRWDLARPYVIAQGAGGWCVHCGPDRRCAVHAARPLTCRLYDCRRDTRVWLDFEARVPAPALATF